MSDDHRPLTTDHKEATERKIQVMDPATLALIIAAIRAAIEAAPTVVDIVKKGKDFIASLFQAGLITKDTQDRVHAHVDAIQAAALSGGALPPQWTVEADPS
jgi:hypothetical protein